MSEKDKVLIIDDSEQDRELASGLLQREGYEVREAASGEQGLELIDSEQPDLVLLDLGLPDMDGAQVIAHLRAIPGCREIPVVIVTGREEMDQGVPLKGAVVMTKANGMLPHEIAGWIQGLVDAGVTSDPGPQVPTAVIAP